MEFDFSKPVTSLDAVPEQFRAMFTEKDGGFALKDTPEVKGATEAIVGLNKALRASRAESDAHKGAKVDLSALSEYGSSVDEITAGVAAKVSGLEESVKGGKEAKVNIEKIKADLAAGHARQMEAKEKRIKALTSQLHSHLVDSEISKALSTKAVDVDLASPHVRKRVTVAEEDGEIKVFVVDDAGDRRYSGVTGSLMSITELVKEMSDAPKFAPLFKSESRRGAGSPPGDASNRTPAQRGGEPSNPVAKIAQDLEDRGI